MDALRALDIFVRVVERNSFNKAAADLGLSHGMASAVVKELEAKHGVEFIRRTTRRMALTEEGQNFFERARRILDDVRELDESLDKDRNTVKGKLVVQAPSAFSRIILGPALGDFLSQHPALKFSLLSRDRYPDLIAEGIDMLIYVGPLPESGLVAKSIGRFPILTTAAPSYIARCGRPKRPKDLAGHDLIDIISATSGRSLDWRFTIDGKTVLQPVTSNLRFESSEAAVAAAIGGAGVLQNISYAVTDHIAAGRLELLLAQWREPGPEIHLVTRRYQTVPSRLRLFSAFLRQLSLQRQERDEALLHT